MAYQSIFERMNRKEKRAFNNLSPDEKVQIIQQELNNKVSASMQDEIVNSFYRGYLQAFKLLGENYLDKIASTEDGNVILETTTNMIAEIKRNYDVAVATFEKLDTDKKESEE